MSDLSRKTVSIYLNHGPAQQSLEVLQKEADKLTDRISKGTAAGKSMTAELTKLGKTNTAIADLRKQIENGILPSFKQLQSAVAKANAELKSMSASDPAFAAKRQQVQALTAEYNKLGSQINVVKQHNELFAGSFGHIFERVAEFTSAYAILNGLKNLFTSTITEALEADKATARFKGTLDNLGKADSFERLVNKADAMAKRFKFIDNDEVVGVFEKLITFGKLTEAQIDKLTPVIINFASKSNISLSESASVILKALEGNGKALKEYGINIKDAKTDTERFAIVTGELADKVNGAADAFGSSTQGKIAETQQSIKDLKEEIGTGLLPLLRSVLQGVNGLIDGVKSIFENISIDEAVQKIAEQHIKDVAGFAERVADQMVGKTIADQQKIVDGQQRLYQASVQQLSNFLNSADKNNVQERNRLLEQQERDEKIFLATQRTLAESIAQDKKNKEKAAADDAEANAKKAEAARKKAEEEAKRFAEEQARLAEEFRKKNLENIERDYLLRANAVKDQYRRDADDQSKSLAERLEALRKFYAATQALIDHQKEVATQKLNEDTTDALSKAKTPEARKQVLAAQSSGQKFIDDTAAQNSATTQQDLLKDTTKVQAEELEKMVKAAQKAYKEIADAAAKSHKDQVDTIEINKDAKLLQLDKALQDGKIKNIEDYTHRREAIESAARVQREQADLQELELQRSFGDKSLELEKKIADLKVAISKEGVDQSEKDDQQRVDKAQQTATDIANVADGVLNIVTSINSLKNQQDDAAIAKNNQRQDEEKNKLTRQLNQKLISQKEYDRQVKAVEEKTRKENAIIKKKEFERDKNAQIVAAIIAGARAVIQALDYAPPLSFIFAGIAGALTIAQIALIKNQKAPEFAKGGVLDGPQHKSGGMPVYNPRTGRKVAELEGGEPILSRETYRNNKSLVDELLFSSMYGHGAPIVPAWKSRRYESVNFAGITRTMERIKRYETGGVFTSGDTSSTTVNNLASQVPFTELMETLQALRADINAPKKNYVLISDVNAANDVLDNIEKETTIKRTAG